MRVSWKGAILTLAGQHPTYGYRRITAMLKRQGQGVNHKRVARLMQELGFDGQTARQTKNAPRTVSMPSSAIRIE